MRLVARQGGTYSPTSLPEYAGLREADGVSVLDRLRRLDSKVDPALRRDGESADEFLRRISTGFWRGNPNRWELQAALREHFAEQHGG